MASSDFPQVPELEAAIRSAHRALEGIAGGHFVAEEELRDFTEVAGQFFSLVDAAQQAIAAQVGPTISWQAPHEGGNWDLVVAGIDLDGGELDFDDVFMDETVFQGPTGEWRGCAFNLAARAYSREAGWDFAPGKAGLWVVMLAPHTAFGGDEDEEDWHYTGNLVGFVIVHDRDEDGAYESVAHIWTASGWRRRGIARRLLAEARSRFPITGVEGPNTADGDALLQACDADDASDQP